MTWSNFFFTAITAIKLVCSTQLLSYSLWLAHANSAANPLLYCLFSRNIRQCEMLPSYNAVFPQKLPITVPSWQRQVSTQTFWQLFDGSSIKQQGHTGRVCTGCKHRNNYFLF